MGVGDGDLYERLLDVATRPAACARATIAALWTDPHLSEQTLRFHPDGTVDAASRHTRFIGRSVWLMDTGPLGAGPGVIDLPKWEIVAVIARRS